MLLFHLSDMENLFSDTHPAQSVQFGFHRFPGRHSLSSFVKDPVAGPCVEAIIFHILEKSRRNRERWSEGARQQILLVIPREIDYNIDYISVKSYPQRKEGIQPMKLQNDLGEIRISSEVFTAVTGSAATNCYGVKGMAVRSKTDGLVHLLKRESMAKGVKVYYNEDGTVSIELHIIVENGVNLMAVCRSIMSEVRYVVSKTTGVEVKSVDVCVDSMRF